MPSRSVRERRGGRGGLARSVSEGGGSGRRKWDERATGDGLAAAPVMAAAAPAATGGVFDSQASRWTRQTSRAGGDDLAMDGAPTDKAPKSKHPLSAAELARRRLDDLATAGDATAEAVSSWNEEDERAWNEEDER